jgi:hypothetical protein
MMKNKQQSGASSRFWEAMDGASRVALTFHSEYARQRPNLEFITTRHPLAYAAIEYWKAKSLTGVPAVRIELDVKGVNKSKTLHAVVVLDDGRSAPRTADSLFKQVQQIKSLCRDLTSDDDSFAQTREQAANDMARKREEVEEETVRRNTALIAARTASIRASFEAKIRRAELTLSQVSDPRLERMYGGQIKNLQARMKAKLEELREGANVEAGYQLIAGGRIRIVQGGAEADWKDRKEEAVTITGAQEQSSNQGVPSGEEAKVEAAKKSLLARILAKRARR